jgi:hypothetical protein
MVAPVLAPAPSPKPQPQAQGEFPFILNARVSGGDFSNVANPNNLPTRLVLRFALANVEAVSDPLLITRAQSWNLEASLPVSLPPQLLFCEVLDITGRAVPQGTVVETTGLPSLGKVWVKIERLLDGHVSRNELRLDGQLKGGFITTTLHMEPWQGNSLNEIPGFIDGNPNLHLQQ